MVSGPKSVRTSPAPLRRMSLTVFAPPPAQEIRALEEQISDRKQRRNSVPRDSFYYAVSRQFQLKGKHFTPAKLRRKCVTYLRDNDVIGSDETVNWKDGISFSKVEEYFTYLDDQNEEHVDDNVIQAAANLLKYTIKITSPGVDDQAFKPNNPKDKPRFITIGRIGGQHYYSLEDDQTVLSNEALKKGAELLQGAGPTKTALKDKNANPTGERKRVTMRGPSTQQSTSAESTDDSDDDISRWGRSGSDPISTESEGEENVRPFFKRETEEESQEEEGFFLKLAKKLAKYVSTVIFAGAVFLGGITTKSTLLVLGNAYSQDYSGSSCPSVGDQHYYTRYMIMLILMTCLCFPEVLALLLSLWKVIKKNKKTKSKSQEERNSVSWKLACLVGMIPEILHAIGVTFLALKVIPSIDSTLVCLAFSLVAMIPAVQQVIGKHICLTRRVEPEPVEFQGSISSIRSDVQRRREQSHRKRDFVLSVFAVVLLPAGYGLIHWQIYEQYENAGFLACTLASLLFISTRYWENFVLPVTAKVEQASPDLRTSPGQQQTPSHDSESQNASMAQGVAKKLQEYRFESTIVYSIIRMCFIVVCCFIIHFVIDGNQSIVAFKGNAPVYFRESPRIDTRCSRIIRSFWYAGLTNVLCSFGTFFIGLLACKTCIRVPAYLLPLAFTNPTMSALTAAYNVEGAQKGHTLMDFFMLPMEYSYVNNLIGWKTTYNKIDPLMMAVVVIVGVFTGCMGLVFVTTYLWKERKSVMERVDVQFVKPIYAGPLINEEMMLNQRQYDASASGDSMHIPNNYIPHVFLCATMWHETPEEMKQLLTSIMRLDRFQVETKKRNRRSQENDKDSFEFEVHVLFDDAFEREDNECRLNTYVKTFLDLIRNAADTVERDSSKEILPVQMETPYGGRIMIRLPKGKNLMHVHLKDTTKIRKKKRWSQCMYLSYILLHLPDARRRTYDLSKVFILALDGDVDFQPSALIYLLDTMKTNKQVGAACGRIHPIGSGPVVWFQKFEYAVGHWLQKTAEDVLGCVLCSPGCFSLFRGEALTRPNVAAKYHERASEAEHKIQWDQGEDRWLCTLLLKQGLKIEYCAASDSYTFAPEEFKEFYNQRRRWGPSTVANVFDILLDAKKAVRNNSNITWGYIIYQAGLMFSSLLGPATVVLVVQGAFQYVFGMSPIGGLMTALIPVVVFVIICYTTKPDTQIAVAMVLTLLYALVMMAVLVGVIGQMAESLLNPSSLFMLLMIAIFTVTGILHPTEIMCLIHGVLYYLCVPSAFIFLPVYSYCNMDNVSWGTREEPKIKALQNNAGGVADEERGNYGCGFGNMCRCMLCLNPPKQASSNGPNYHGVVTTEPSTTRTFNQRKIRPQSPTISKLRRRKLIKKLSRAESIYMGEEDIENIPEDTSAPQYVFSQSRVFWKPGSQLENAATKEIDKMEQEFWEDLINGYLKPIDQIDKQEIKKEKKLKVDLQKLKNKMSGAYLFINSLWIVLTFTLTLVIDDVNITIYDRYGNPTVLNPLAFLFLIFFFVILTIQFTAMLFHRGHTFVHLMSRTYFCWNDKANTEDKFDQRRIQPSKPGIGNLSFHEDQPGTSGGTATRETRGAWGEPTNSEVRFSSEVPKRQDIPPHQVPQSQGNKDGKAKNNENEETALATPAGGPATEEPKSSDYQTSAA